MLKQACPVDSCTASLRVACWLMGFSSSLITIPSRPAPYHDAKSILLSFIGSRRSRLFATGFYTEFETLGHRTLHLRSSAGPGWFAVCSKANISMPKNQACQAYHLTSIWLYKCPAFDPEWPTSSSEFFFVSLLSFSILFICFAGGQAQRQKQSCRWRPEMCTSARLPFLHTKSESRNFDQFGILMNVVHILLMNIDEYCTFVMICSTVSLYHFLFIVSQLPVSVLAFQSCLESRIGLLAHVSGERRSSGSSNSNCLGRIWHRTRCVSNKAKSWSFMKSLFQSRQYIYTHIYIYIYYIIYSQYVLERGPMDGAFIARCGGLASDGPKIGPDFATAPMVPSHADAPWFGHWFGHFTRRRCRDVTRCWLWS
jgi:hypothetical protein